ncbi:juvenile hormone epoxide hydrolase-like isoform X2 [Plodia interpunctella]|uniref:juvenile hormone epoxide hydrolase-like isoform X2 n=1 Tax=Plodia interpunctella TaxID=58824 RepID=UPI002368E8F4|nr:juvenile hormone epoxide hydrolase-like isoform X2 [Plodia interpunctella]
MGKVIFAAMLVDSLKNIALSLTLVQALVVLGLTYWLFLQPSPPIPTLDYDEWWGPETSRKVDRGVTPFNITFSDDMINDLKYRLKNHVPFSPPLDGVGFEYGFNTNILDEWVDYWAQKYPFKQKERFLNKFPQYKTNIQGLDIHFIRVKPQAKNKEIIPLLLLHGWPGSVREFYESIPFLTAVSDSRDFVLEVIVASLPGYGFSDPAVRPGLGPAQMAVVMRNLMHRLGHEKFYIQGGDWGSQVSHCMTVLFPTEILGSHINFGIVSTLKAMVAQYLISFYPTLFMDKNLVDRLEYNKGIFRELGYFHLQSTKPDTLGVSLNDSPVALLAYILEKSAAATDFDNIKFEDGGTRSWRFTKDQILDNLMIYWASNSITTSMRIYAESCSKAHNKLGMQRIKSIVPTWLVQAKNEIYFQPPLILNMKYKNLVNITILNEGGHFLAWEMPLTFSEDVLMAVDVFRKLKSSVEDEL